MCTIFFKFKYIILPLKIKTTGYTDICVYIEVLKIVINVIK